MSQFRVRTDLAVEARDYVMDANEECRGIRVEETKEGDIQTTTVFIDTKNASKAMGKPMGCYITIEASRLDEMDEDYQKIVSKIVSKSLREIIKNKKREKSVLIVGLGNREVTADHLKSK